MVVDERSRHALYQHLAELLGSEDATTLMEHLPSLGWGDVATRRDVTAEVALLRADLTTLRIDLQGQIGGLCKDLEGQRTDLEGQIRTVRSGMGEMEQRIIAAIRGELVKAVTSQTRLMIFSLIASLGTLGGLLLTAVRLS
ncbi:MAG: hypothetical protein ACRDU8_04030 [Egibacteraceae bacterium]